MVYALYAVVDIMPQIAAAAFLPIVGIAVVGYLVRTTRPRSAESPIGLD
jgi:hypothetical protein